MTHIRPATAIVVFTNAISFMIMQTLFFWFIMSKSVSGIIDDKSMLIRQIGKSIPEIDELVLNFINSSEFQKKYELALSDNQKRIDHNTQLLWTWMIPPFSIIVGFLSLSVLLEVYFTFRNIRPAFRFDKIDFILLMSVFMAFLTEVVFYFTVVSRSKTISDMDVLSVLIKNSDINIQQILMDYLLFEVPDHYRTYVPSVNEATLPPTPPY